MRVLHVSDVMGGGVLTSVTGMVEATPEIDHHLFARSRGGHDTGADPTERFGSVHTMPANSLSAVVELRRLCRELFPDVVHAHSSVAGTMVRLAGVDARVVYSPHCFAFERRDLTQVQRRLVTAVERRLAGRTDMLIAVAPSELDIAARLGYRHLAYAPNRAALEGVPVARHSDRLRIVGVGRICRQKDWRFFLHVKRYVERELGVNASWEWLGGGPERHERELERAGVSVSGWLEHGQVLRRLSRAQVFLHTAAWEAGPLSVLEAAAVGLPLVLRGIESLNSLELPGISDSAVGLAHRIAELESADRWQAAQQHSIQLASRYSREVQGRRLLDAYAHVCADLPEALHLGEQRTELPVIPAQPVRWAVGAGDERHA